MIKFFLGNVTLTVAPLIARAEIMASYEFQNTLTHADIGVHAQLRL